MKHYWRSRARFVEWASVEFLILLIFRYRQLFIVAMRPPAASCVFVLLLVFCICLFSGASLVAESAAPGQWIVVTPTAFKPALAPLIEARRREGFNVTVLEMASGTDDAAAVLARVRNAVGHHAGTSDVLLAGAWENAGPGGVSNIIVPSLPGVVERMKGQPTDLGFGLPGADGAPTVAVGRFPARNAEELAGMVQKTLRFESDGGAGAWRNRLLLLIGDPGGGMLGDLYMTATLDSDLACLDPVWTVRALFDISSSRFFLTRPLAHKQALQFLKEGDLFTVYLGHSNRGGIGFLDRRDLRTVEIPQGNGPFFTCGCFALQAVAGDDGYGLTAMRNSNGPVAVIGATEESYSAAGQLAAEGLLTRLGKAPFPERLGDYWLAVAAGLARGPMDPSVFTLLDAADGSGGKENLPTVRAEHLEMWMLLGDPALRLPAVQEDILIDTPPAIARNAILTVTGALPQRLAGASVKITLERPLNSAPVDLEQVPDNRAEAARVLAANEARANAYVITSADAATDGNRFTATLKVPEALPWTNLILKASGTLSNETAFGVRVVSLSAAPVAQSK